MEKECRTDLVTYLKKLKLQGKFSEPSDRVSCDQLDGGPIKDYDHWMKRHCAAAGVPYFGFKGIRHLVAVELYRAGHPVTEIQRRLRHESPMTTKRYLRSLGLDVGSAEVIETLGILEKGELKKG
jgi:integrase